MLSTLCLSSAVSPLRFSGIPQRSPNQVSYYLGNPLIVGSPSFGAHQGGRKSTGGLVRVGVALLGCLVTAVFVQNSTRNTVQRQHAWACHQAASRIVESGDPDTYLKMAGLAEVCPNVRKQPDGSYRSRPPYFSP